jgi:hypothetical protein
MQIYVGFSLPPFCHDSLKRMTEWVGFFTINHKPKIRLASLHGYVLRDTQSDHASLPETVLHSEWPGCIQISGYIKSDHASLPDTGLHAVTRLHYQIFSYAHSPSFIITHWDALSDRSALWDSSLGCTHRNQLHYATLGHTWRETSLHYETLGYTRVTSLIIRH